MFTKEYTFRYSDLDNKGNIKHSTVFDILQDISIIHSSKAGYPIKKLNEKKIAFLLQGWHIHFIDLLTWEDPVLVKTGLMKMHRCEALRKYEIWQGNTLKVQATADWFTVNTEKMRITAIPSEMYDSFDNINEEDNGIAFVKLHANENLEKVLEKKIERRDIDTNNHLNNVKSVELVLESLPGEEKISAIQVTYKKAILKDEIISIYMAKTETGHFIQLENEANEACVMVNIICD